MQKLVYMRRKTGDFLVYVGFIREKRRLVKKPGFVYFDARKSFAYARFKLLAVFRNDNGRTLYNRFEMGNYVFRKLL